MSGAGSMYRYARTIAGKAVREHRATQHEDELADLVQLVANLAPQVIIEIGCGTGGSLWAWNQVAPHVLGVTRDTAVAPHGASVHVGDSHGREAYLWVVRQLRGRAADFLFLDGDRDPYGVLADFDMYAHLVRPGGLVAVNEVVNPDESVRLAWLTISSMHPNTRMIRPAAESRGIGVVYA